MVLDTSSGLSRSAPQLFKNVTRSIGNPQTEHTNLATDTAPSQSSFVISSGLDIYFTLLTFYLQHFKISFMTFPASLINPSVPLINEQSEQNAYKICMYTTPSNQTVIDSIVSINDVYFNKY